MTTERSDLAARLSEGAIFVLDGATGTELERRGVPTDLPLWSAPALRDHPDVLEQIHADYVAAGVDALTANTFRTQRRTLARGGWGDRADALTARAVILARRGAARAAHGRRIFVLGSAPPLEDCYRPDRVPDDAALEREHAEHARHLVAAGVDAVLVETMNSIREAVAATRAARRAGAAVLTSFVCWNGARLLSGESLAEAVKAVAAEDPLALLVNCLPPSNVPACLAVLATQPRPSGAYANLGAPDDTVGFRRSEDCTPEAFAAHARGWIEAGARIVGGCCGTTPEHLRAVAAQRSGASERAPKN
ncbi:MAG: homocysteine S-methyltransferase family protein [Myxococcales bacterium]|nr:homocysteine S-methyltransferase family protein [Myxococcales bacterium]